MSKNGMQIEPRVSEALLVIKWGDGTEDTVLSPASRNIEHLLRKAYSFGSRAGYELGYRVGGRDEDSRNSQGPGNGDMGG